MPPQTKDGEKGEVLSGYVEKKSRLGSWNKRYFVLLHGDFFLSYYPDDKKDRGPDGERGGYVDLRHCNLIQIDGKIITLHLHDKTKYRLRFGQISEAKKWRNALYAVSIRVHSESENLRPLPTKPDSPPPRLFADKDKAKVTKEVSIRDEMSLERPQPESLGFYLLLRVWLAVALVALASSCVAVIPVPSLDFWFFKIFVLSGVFHATFLTLVSLAAVFSAIVVNTGKSRRSRRPSLCAGALGCFMVAGGIAAFPAVVNIPLAAHLPARVDEFLSASNLSFVPNSRVKALDLGEFLVDPPCALANVWEYYEHTNEIIYKQIPESTVEKTGLTIEDWSGFGGLSNRENEHGLRLAIFGTDTKNNLDIHVEASSLKPVVLSLHGGGWYRGSLYDGLQCYLPAALASGAAVVAAEYRSGADGWSGRDMVDDAMDAIEWIMEHGAAHGLDTSKLVVMGGSAGAHVGITAAYLLNKRHGRELVRGVVARYGAIGDLTAAHAKPSALPQGLGGGSGWSERVALEHIARGTPTEVASEYSYLSPLTHVDQYSPPTVMLHCRHDEFYDLQTHAVALSDALAAVKRPHLLIAPHLHGHGCDIGSTAPFQLLRFALVHLLDALKREASPIKATAVPIIPTVPEVPVSAVPISPTQDIPSTTPDNGTTAAEEL